MCLGRVASVVVTKRTRGPRRVSLHRNRDGKEESDARRAHTSSSISNREKPPYFGSASPAGGAGGAVLPIATSLEDCIEGGGIGRAEMHLLLETGLES